MNSIDDEVTEQLLSRQKAAGTRALRFEPRLERSYREEAAAAMRERSRPVAISAVALFSSYAGLDLLLMPEELSSQTVLVRLLFVCPMALLVLALSYYSRLSDTLFAYIYNASYFLGGLSVVLIILLARRQELPLPYDGLLLMLMFGFFLMGLSFHSVSLMSAVLVFTYIVIEWYWQVPEVTFSFNSFFILTALVIGIVGAWLRESAARQHFLDRRMLELSRRRAQTDSHQKTRFIAAASHDLRHPLNVINLILENLRYEDDPGRRDELFDRLRRSVHQLNRLLGTLLDLSRIQQGMVQPRIEVLSVGAVLEQMQGALQEKAANAGIKLSWSCHEKSLGVCADPVLVQRILINLVHNAIQHAHCRWIEVRASSLGEQVVFVVSDDGRGIPEGTNEALFDPFYRANNDESEEPGLGLGLAIVRELSDLMGGHCEVQSRPGQGSCFRVVLPKASSVAVLPSVDSGDTGKQGQPPETVLVVEDHDDSRKWLVSLLGHWGYRVEAYGDEGEALEAVKAKREFALVISDFHLRETDGRTLIAQLRQLQPDFPAILLTADAQVEQRHDLEEGLWIVHKPVPPARLRVMIKQLTNC